LERYPLKEKSFSPYRTAYTKGEIFKKDLPDFLVIIRLVTGPKILQKYFINMFGLSL